MRLPDSNFYLKDVVLHIEGTNADGKRVAIDVATDAMETLLYDAHDPCEKYLDDVREAVPGMQRRDFRFGGMVRCWEISFRDATEPELRDGLTYADVGAWIQQSRDKYGSTVYDAPHIWELLENDKEKAEGVAGVVAAWSFALDKRSTFMEFSRRLFAALRAKHTEQDQRK